MVDKAEPEVDVITDRGGDRHEDDADLRHQR